MFKYKIMIYTPWGDFPDDKSTKADSVVQPAAPKGTLFSLTIGNTVLYAVNRNMLTPGDWIETNDGTFAKVEKLEFREVYTDKGVIKKRDIKQMYVTG